VQAEDAEKDKLQGSNVKNRFAIWLLLFVIYLPALAFSQEQGVI
jgi:hypothetical protein